MIWNFETNFVFVKQRGKSFTIVVGHKNENYSTSNFTVFWKHCKQTFFKLLEICWNSEARKSTFDVWKCNPKIILFLTLCSFEFELLKKLFNSFFRFLHKQYALFVSLLQLTLSMSLVGSVCPKKNGSIWTLGRRRKTFFTRTQKQSNLEELLL